MVAVLAAPETLVPPQPWEAALIFVPPMLLALCVSWMMDPGVLPWEEDWHQCSRTIRRFGSCTK